MGFWETLHGEDLIELYAELLLQLHIVEAERDEYMGKSMRLYEQAWGVVAAFGPAPPGEER